MRLREYLGDILPKPLLSMKSAALGVDRTSSGVFTSAGALSWVLHGGTPFICRPTRLYAHLEWTCKTSTNPALGILTTCFLRRHIYPSLSGFLVGLLPIWRSPSFRQVDSSTGRARPCWAFYEKPGYCQRRSFNTRQDTDSTCPSIARIYRLRP